MCGGMTTRRQLGSKFTSKQRVDRTRIAVENAKRGAGLNHGDARELPVRKGISCAPGGGCKCWRRPDEVHDQALIAIIICQTVRRVPQIELVVRRQLQLEGVSSTFPADLIQILGPRIACLKLESMLHPFRDA